MRNLSLLLLFLVLISAIGCCVEEEKETISAPATTSNPASTAEEQYGIDLSTIPVDTPELITTNGSSIAAIALQDKRAQELIRRGGIPEKIAVIFHSCPRDDPYCDRDPKLFIRYRDILFAFIVDEEAGEVRGGGAQVPNSPDQNKPSPTYYKIRDVSNRTDSVYLGDTLMMKYNDTSFLFFNESFERGA